MIEVEDRSERQRLARIRRAAETINGNGKRGPKPKPAMPPPPIAHISPTMRLCVYRIITTTQGRELRRVLVKAFDAGEDETAQQYALGRNLAESSDNFYLVVRVAA